MKLLVIEDMDGNDELSQLVARIESILTRSRAPRADSIHVSDLHIDLLRRKVTRGEARLHLTPKEFQLLSLLARQPGQVISRAAINRQLWDSTLPSEANVIEVHIRRLRSKLDDPFEKKLIHTVRGSGYVLEER